MATVTIRDMPASMLDALKSRASVDRRSLNGEILYIFDHVVSGAVDLGLPSDSRARRQAEALKAVFGKWEDDRSEEYIVRDIVSSRTKGREASL